jgi:hypothetical protein
MLTASSTGFTGTLAITIMQEGGLSEACNYTLTEM